ncbi:hypothetical protein JCM13991_10900 [Thermodesulfovibrio hydrogeniphilus]
MQSLGLLAMTPLRHGDSKRSEEEAISVTASLTFGKARSDGNKNNR